MDDTEELEVAASDHAAESAHKAMRFRNVLRSGADRVAVSPYLPIAEDLDWLRET